MDGTVAWPVERAARTNGEAEAAVDGSTRLTWRQLRARLVSLGGGLARHEIAIGDRVGVLAHNSLIHLEAWLGLPAQGRVINDLNLRLSAAEQAFMVDDCETRALIVDDDHLGPRNDLPRTGGEHARGDQLHGRHIGAAKGGDAQPPQPARERQALHHRLRSHAI